MKNPYEIRGEITAILLRHRDWSVREALIDTADLPKVQVYDGTWTAHWSKHAQSYYVDGYEPVSGKIVKLHRYLVDAPTGLVVDHINHDGLDNRRRNLRVLSQGDNMQNKRMYKNNTSGHRNVSWKADNNRWEVQINVNGHNHYIGVYECLEDAIRSAREARLRLLQFAPQEEVEAVSGQ